jgi:hypothetical protein
MSEPDFADRLGQPPRFATSPHLRPAAFAVPVPPTHLGAIPDYVPDDIAQDGGIREGFIGIRHGCGETLQVPLGPDFWLPSSSGAVIPRLRMWCPACRSRIIAVTSDMVLDGDSG